jgi:hypothetical protein
MAQIKTLRKPGKQMGWSPAKVLRRDKLDFPPLRPDKAEDDLKIDSLTAPRTRQCLSPGAGFPTMGNLVPSGLGFRVMDTIVNMTKR